MCVNPDCGAIDEMDEVYISDKGGNIFTFTSDQLAATVNPPAIYGFVDFNGGGRALLDFTDCALDEVAVGKAVDLGFRVKYYDPKPDITFYSWKAVPVTGEVV
jgi:uncharacterized OB-fold protein